MKASVVYKEVIHVKNVTTGRKCNDSVTFNVLFKQSLSSSSRVFRSASTSASEAAVPPSLHFLLENESRAGC